MSKFQPALIRPRAFTDSDRLAAVSAYCQDHLAEKITLSSAAAAAGLEYTYFSSFFHSAVGVRFGDWLRYQRILKAQALIRTSNHSLSQIAAECGFNNLRTFQRAFRRIADMTPRQFRREIKLGFSTYDVPRSPPLFTQPARANESI